MTEGLRVPAQFNLIVQEIPHGLLLSEKIV